MDNILSGIVAAGLYDVLKYVVRRLRNTPEYAPEKKIEIIQEDDGHKEKRVITMQEIIEGDKR